MPRYHTRRHKTKGRRSKLTRSRRVRRQHGGNPKPKIQAQYIEFGQLKGELPLKKANPTDPDVYGPNTLPGIYFSLSETDFVNDNLVMIIAPRYPIVSEADVRNNKYPLEECLFFFKMGFPADYPSSSPKMKHITPMLSPRNPRIHPNLYANSAFDSASDGKVCLSILGTWSGPAWNSDMNIASTLATVQSIIGPNIIVNEPGYEALPNGNPQVVNYNMQSFVDALEITLSVYEKVLTASSKDALTPDFLQPFYDELRQRAFTALKFFVRKLTTLKRLHPGGFVATPDIHHPYARTIDFDAFLSRVITLLPMVPPDLAVELESEDTSVKTVEEARKAEEAARSAARIMETAGAAGGEGPAPMTMNAWFASLPKPIPEPSNGYWAASTNANHLNWLANKLQTEGNSNRASKFREKAALKRKVAKVKYVDPDTEKPLNNGNGNNENEYHYSNTEEELPQNNNND